MSNTDAADRAHAATQNDKGWSAGLDRVSKDGVSGSAGVKVYESESGNVQVGAALSVSKDFHGGKPEAGIGVAIEVKIPPADNK